MPSSFNFRDFVPPPGHPRITDLDKTTPEAYSALTLARPVVAEIVAGWKANLEKPFYGITSDGTRREGLFEIADEGAPVGEMVTCAQRVIDLLTSDELERLSHPVDSDEWRKWSNPEFLIYRTGIRLEDLSDATVDLPLNIRRSLPHDLQRAARVYEKLQDESMPPGRWNPADQRHLAGAFQDNRIIPYEGITDSSMPAQQQAHLRNVIASFFEILPAGPFTARMRLVERFWDETYFCWIGGFASSSHKAGGDGGDGEGSDAFYYRIQSPVVLIGFDHHSGVFLLNKEPARYHVHTVVRTPNGGDYRRGLLRLFSSTLEK